MATIGSWGTDIVFSVSDSRILTFSEFSRQVSATWANHGRIGLKDQTEFVKPDLQQISFSITLDAALGIKPRKTLDALAEYVETGATNPLAIGGKRVGANSWKIKSVSEAWDIILTGGELVRATVKVTMEEYL